MSPTIIILLLVIAIGLVLVEIFLVPGVGIPGIAGALLMLACLVLAYNVSPTFGNYTLAATGLISIGLVLLAFRAKTWQKLSLKSGIDSKVDRPIEGLAVGDVGEAISRMNPMGKAMFHDHFYEVSSKGDYIDAHSSVEITNIEGTKITVIKK
ncbi:MAG: NfeD family protein [Flavobacteriales bacterium]|nr:NfeD family protein [Flavobacteriales bacterium]